MPSALDALAELERRHDGPIPDALRRGTRLGALAPLLEAAGQAAFFATMVRGQVATIRRRRAEGTAYPALLADLALYRREWRRWRRRLVRLQRQLAVYPPSKTNSAPVTKRDSSEAR
jgi:hypothetical protein